MKLINFFDCKIFLFAVKSWNDDLNSVDERVNKEKVEEEEANREEDEYNREFDAGKVSFFFFSLWPYFNRQLISERN